MNSEIKGNTVPRIYTPEKRELTYETSLGFQIIEFANEINIELLPWQEWVLIHAFELSEDGTLRFRTVLVKVARQNGKTLLKRVVSLWRLYRFDARLVVGTAQDLAQAREVMRETIAMIEASDILSPEYGSERKALGNEYFWLGDSATEPRANDPRYIIKALNRASGRGLTVDELNIDELREQTDWNGWAAMSKTTMVPLNAQNWLMSNAGDNDSVVLNRLTDVAMSGQDDSLFIAEYSADDRLSIDDIEGWKQGNPALGYTLPIESIRSSMVTDPPRIFRMEVLCQNSDTWNAVINMQAWRESIDRQAMMEVLLDRVVFCIDASDDLRHVALIAAADVDGEFILVETVAVWDSTSDVSEDIKYLNDNVRPRKFGWFPSGPTIALSTELRSIDSYEIKAEEEAAACSGLAEQISHRKILNNGDPLLDSQLKDVKRQNVGDRWKFERRGAGHVNAAYSVAGAVYLARIERENSVPRVRWI